jgi:hypothetical protein
MKARLRTILICATLLAVVVRGQTTQQTLAALELQLEFGPDSLGRTSLVDVVDFTASRGLFDQFYPEGLTQIGCRIRAFNRIDDYLLQTINEAEATSVIDAEFLNASMINETIAYFIEYNLIKKNLYMDDFLLGYQELIFPSNACAHMWITYTAARGLCFNDACLVSDETGLRNFSASNG